ncbi:MAG: hypothetical protein WAO24_07370 [Peptococcia bacterium]|jgi:hypothetical protein
MMGNRTRGQRPYMPLCNHHLRFYFSNPERKKFRNEVERKQFLAAKKALNELSIGEYEIIREIINPKEKYLLDISNRYINSNVQAYCSENGSSPNKIYGLLRRVTDLIALDLEYVGK